MIVFILLFGITGSSSNVISKGGREIFLRKVGPIGNNVTVFRSEKILAEVNFDGDRPVHCRLSSVYLPRDDEVIAQLFGDVYPVGDEKMLKLVTICGNLETHVIQETPFDDAIYMFRKIFPGTLWCGPGNVAESYNSLGRSTEVDRCCRNHDYCPICVAPHTDRYGFNRTFEYSVVSCECDLLFHQCLKKVEAEDYMATLVLEVYFSLYNPRCVGFSKGKPTAHRLSDVLRENSLA